MSFRNHNQSQWFRNFVTPFFRIIEFVSVTSSYHILFQENGPQLLNLSSEKAMAHKFGFHISISGGLEKAFARAKELGCTTMQIFSRNPRGWRSAPLTQDQIEAWHREAASYSSIEPVVIHMPYLPNLAATKEDQREKSYRSLTDELRRAGALGIPYICTHVGKAMLADPAGQMKQVAQMCDQALEETAADGITDPMLLLENTAGQGTEVGTRMEELGTILAHSKYAERYGICLDTCHAHAAGYDLSTETGLEQLIAEIEQFIGLDKIKVIHFNDSMKPCGSRVDRHQHIGKGTIGEAGLRNILFHPVLRDLPFIMETPENEEGNDAQNMATVLKLTMEA